MIAHDRDSQAGRAIPPPRHPTTAPSHHRASRKPCRPRADHRIWRVRSLRQCRRLNSAAQRSAAQHSTAQRSTAQHSTAQHSTAQWTPAIVRESHAALARSDSGRSISSWRRRRATTVPPWRADVVPRHRDPSRRADPELRHPLDHRDPGDRGLLVKTATECRGRSKLPSALDCHRASHSRHPESDSPQCSRRRES